MTDSLALAEQASRHSAGAVHRLIEDAADGLYQLRSSTLVDDGLVNMITIDTIAERLGTRWESRRDQVYDHVETVMHRKIGPTGLLVRVSDTDYLVAQPELGVFAGQAVCLRAMNEILHFFLGPSRRRDMDVHRVTTLTAFEIAAQPVDAKSAVEGERREAKAAAQAMETEQVRSYLLSPERWSPFVAANGRKVRVSCHLEPVLELKRHKRIGYRLHRRVLDLATGHPLPAKELNALSRGDLLRIDMATISRGMARLLSAAESERELSLVIPVSYVTLSHHEGRALMAKAFSHARDAVEKGVICEVHDIECVPQAPLLTAVCLIKPSTLFVVGHLTDDPPHCPSSLKEAGLHALSVDCPASLTGDAEFIGWVRAAIAEMRKISRSVIVYGCAGPRRAGLAAAMGATHASLAKPV